MEGRKKERVMASAVCVLVILLSAQRLPVGVADPTSAFCQECYAPCYEGCMDDLKRQDCHDYCCATCYFPGDPDFDNECRKQASICGVETTGDDTTSTTSEDAAANYRSRRHRKAEAKHG